MKRDQGLLLHWHEWNDKRTTKPHAREQKINWKTSTCAIAWRRFCTWQTSRSSVWSPRGRSYCPGALDRWVHFCPSCRSPWRIWRDLFVWSCHSWPRMERILRRLDSGIFLWPRSFFSPLFCPRTWARSWRKDLKNWWDLVSQMS